jgi:hypothetical protein
MHLCPSHARVVLLQTFECEEFFFSHGRTVLGSSYSQFGRVTASQTFENSGMPICDNDRLLTIDSSCSATLR